MAPAAEVTVLQFIRGKYRGQEFPLDGRNVVAGRSSDADLVLADDAVSRKHARFYGSRGRIWVRDLGSRNGTHVNGKPVDHYCVRPGDRLAIGSNLCRVQRKLTTQIPTHRAGEAKKRGSSDSAGRSMTGSIEDIPLMDVLQWLATSRKTGALKVRDTENNRIGALHLRDGRVFYAAIEGNPALHPEKALMRMLNWDKGMFDLESGVLENPPVEIDMSLEHMLMEAARQQDELANLAKRSPLPGLGTTVRVVRPSPVRWKDLPAGELEILQDLIERRSWWDILDTSPQDDLTLFRHLVALRGKGVVDY